MAITKPKITKIETDPYGVPIGRIRVTKTDDPNKKVGGGGGGRGMGGGGLSGGGRSNPRVKLAERGFFDKKVKVIDRQIPKVDKKPQTKRKDTTEKDLSRLLGVKLRYRKITDGIQGTGTQFGRLRTKYSPQTIKNNQTDPVTGQPLTMVRTQSATSLSLIHI